MSFRPPINRTNKTMRCTYCGKCLLVKLVISEKCLNPKLILHPPRLNRYRRQILGRQNARIYAVIVKTAGMRQSIFKKLIVNRQKLNRRAPYVYALRHPFVRTITPFPQGVIDGLQRQKAVVVFEQNKHIQIHCNDWLKIEGGTHCAADGVIFNHAISDEFCQYFQCLFHLLDLSCRLMTNIIAKHPHWNQPVLNAGGPRLRQPRKGRLTATCRIPAHVGSHSAFRTTQASCAFRRQRAG